MEHSVKQDKIAGTARVGPTIECVGRTVVVRDSGLFAPGAAALMLPFLRRVFRVAEVDAVQIDLALGTATIEPVAYTAPATLLRHMAKELRSADIGRNDSSIEDLPLVPGAVQFRVKRNADDLPTWEIVSTEMGLWRLIRNALPGWRGSRKLRKTFVGATRDAHATSKAGVKRVAQGLSRVGYLTLAGGSLGMAFVGAVLPGVPTTPFLLVASYGIIRSSPSLNERLMRSKVFGPLLRDWQQYRGMRSGVKTLAIVTMLATTGLTIASGAISPPVMMVVLVMVGMGLWLILWLPTIHPEQST